MVGALGADRDGSLKVLESAAALSTEQQDWRLKTRYAILALHLGAPDLAGSMCQIENRPDPVQRSIFINEFPKWHSDLAEIAELLTPSTNPGLRSAVVLSVGSIPCEQLSSGEKDAWQALAECWYLSQPDSSTHSASAWLLRQWNLQVPKIPADRGRVTDRDWYVNSQGQTLLRMLPGTFRELAESHAKKQDRDVKIAESFWLMDREVSVGQFQCFIDDSEYATADKPADRKEADRQASPTPDHPVNQVSWYDAVLYCNWLSVQDGLPAAYVRSQSSYFGRPEPISWSLIGNSIGYRLPQENEWEYSCRAGTTTDFASGSDEELVPHYAQYRTDKMELCGTKLPNAWGVWDMHGNADEWCNDRFIQPMDPSTPIRSIAEMQLKLRDITRDSVLRGGSFVDRTPFVRSASRHRQQSDNRSYTLGFRLARTFVKDRKTTLPSAEGGSKLEN